METDSEHCKGSKKCLVTVSGRSKEASLGGVVAVLIRFANDPQQTRTTAPLLAVQAPNVDMDSVDNLAD